MKKLKNIFKNAKSDSVIFWVVAIGIFLVALLWTILGVVGLFA